MTPYLTGSSVVGREIRMERPVAHLLLRIRDTHGQYP